MQQQFKLWQFTKPLHPTTEGIIESKEAPSKDIKITHSITFPKFDMDPLQAEAFHQSIKSTGHEERAYVIEALEPGMRILWVMYNITFSAFLYGEVRIPQLTYKHCI